MNFKSAGGWAEGPRKSPRAPIADAAALQLRAAHGRGRASLPPGSPGARTRRGSGNNFLTRGGVVVFFKSILTDLKQTRFWMFLDYT